MGGHVTTGVLSPKDHDCHILNYSNYSIHRHLQIISMFVGSYCSIIRLGVIRLCIKIKNFKTNLHNNSNQQKVQYCDMFLLFVESYRTSRVTITIPPKVNPHIRPSLYYTSALTAINNNREKEREDSN